jgi:Domain of unknown function (DUF4091)
VDVRPTQQRALSPQASLTAARGEFESFQVVIQAGLSGLEQASVSMGELSGPGNATIARKNVTVYREAYYAVGVPSDGEGATGRWPDALIPTVDPFYREHRAAFPVTVPAGENRVAWIDVFVPPGAAAGTYQSRVDVSATGLHVTLPVTLHVVAFTIPATSSLTNAFGFDTRTCLAHYDGACPTGDETYTLNSLYVRAALENRVTVFDPTIFAPPVDDADRQRFKRYLLPFLQGSSPAPDADHPWRPVRLEGARLTSIGDFTYFFRVQDGASVPNTPQCDEGCLRSWKALSARFGFADRFFVYPWDEPGVSEAAWETFTRNRHRDVQVWPALAQGHVLLATDIRAAKSPQVQDDCALFDPTATCPSLIDLFVVPINHMEDRSGPFAGSQRSQYDGFLASQRGRNQLWLYHGCGSYGCRDANPPSPVATSPVWDGWASYAIDEPASEQRAMSWLAFRYRTTGELYYNVVSTLAQTVGGDSEAHTLAGCAVPVGVTLRAWERCGQYYFGGNGDGNLFYPGIPHPAERGISGVPAIGGAHDIPIESMRLKRIRDGREDYEYLRFLSAHGQGAEAMEVARSLYPTPYRSAVSEGAIRKARAQLIQLVLAA